MKKSKLDICIGVVVCSVCFFKAVSYGGSKHASPTNSTPPVLCAGPLRGRGLSQTSQVGQPDVASGGLGNSAAPVMFEVISNWTVRGAYCDWRPITFRDGFRFPVGTNFIDGVTLFAYGEVKVEGVGVQRRSGILSASEQESNHLCTPTPTAYTYQLPARVSLEPNASSITHGLTPSNSYLFAWTNCCVERCATNRVNASIELFRSGAVATTVTPLSTPTPPTYTYQPAVPPAGFPGSGQDEAWVRATFPDEADNILSMGYESWLADEWVGVNEQNGRYLARVTISQPPATNDQPPIYLTCGPYRVNVVAPGTYSFPLEVFETYEVQTYPTAVPFTIDFDDGYTGGGSSYEIINAGDDERRPLRMVGRALRRAPEAESANPIPAVRGLTALPALPSSQLAFYRFYMKPNVIVTPARIPLSTANGSTVSIWCKIADVAQKTYEAVSQELYLAFFGSEAEIHDAFIAERVEIIMQLDQRECRGEFEIYDDDDDEDEEEDDELPEREDDSIFSGESLHSEVSNDCVNVYLTGVTAHGSTMTNLATTAYGLAEGQSADVFVYMATSESGDDQYDDSVGWTVTANGTVGLQGESSVSEHADAVGGSTYGVTSGAVLLASGHFDPPADDILRLRLQCWARNVGDGKKETCVQIIVMPRE